MTRAEAAMILAEMAVNYPDTESRLSNDARKAKANLWAAAFAEESFELVQAAVNAYIVSSSERFAPNIGEIKEQIYRMMHQGEITEGEAWTLVLNALRRSGYEAKAEYDKLPTLVKKVVGSPNQLREWGLMSSETVQSVVASNFRKSYITMQAREKALSKTPPAIREMFATLTKPIDVEAMPAPEPAQEAPRLEAPPLKGEEMRAAITALQIAAGDVIITEDKKTAAIDRLRNYGKE